MSGRLDSFSLSLTKVAKDRNENRPSYLSQMGTFAPAAAIQSAFEFPKGYADKAVESKITGIPSKASSRGFARVGSRFGSALVTTPLFISGIKDIKNAKTDEEKRRGLAKVMGAGAAYGAAKGGLEPLIESGNFKKSLKMMKDVATVRGVLGTVAAASTATAIAKNLKKSDKKNPNKVRELAAQGAAGAAIGALKGGIETAYVNRKNVKSLVKNPRKFLGPTAGRAAAGALGAVVLSEVAKRTMSKVASVSEVFGGTFDRNAIGGYSPSQIYENVYNWANKTPTEKVRSAYQETIDRGAERSPSSRAAFYAMHDVLTEKGYEVQKPVMRDQVTGISKSSQNTQLGLAVAATISPHLINSVLDRMPDQEKDHLIRDSLDSIAASKGIDVYDISDTRSGDFWSKLGLEPGKDKKTIERISKSSGFYAEINRDGKRQKIIGTPRGRAVETFAHEVGHATAKNKLRQLAQTKAFNRAHTLGSIMTMTVPIALSQVSADPSFSTPEEIEAKRNFLLGTTSVGAALMSPLVAEEAIASAKGVDYVRKAYLKGGATKAEALKRSVKAGAKLLPAFATYSSPLAVGALALKYINRDLKEAKEKKNVK